MNQSPNEADSQGAAAPPELAEIPGLAWTMLRRAVADRRHSFRTPTLCTASATDGSPRARTVVLRHVDPDTLTLRCHTDRRASKTAEIEHQPIVAWHFYDAKSRTQLRIRSRATVRLDGPIFDEAWERTALMSRRCYLAPNTPGTPSDGPSPNLPEDLITGDPDRERSEAGRPHFAVIDSQAVEMDWLWLKHSGHRRARFAWSPDGSLTNSGWIEP